MESNYTTAEVRGNDVVTEFTVTEVYQRRLSLEIASLDLQQRA